MNFVSHGRFAARAISAASPWAARPAMLDGGCPAADPAPYLAAVGVLSSQPRLEYRRAIRETWLPEASGVGIVIRFVLRRGGAGARCDRRARHGRRVRLGLGAGPVLGQHDAIPQRVTSAKIGDFRRSSAKIGEVRANVQWIFRRKVVDVWVGLVSGTTWTTRTTFQIWQVRPGLRVLANQRRQVPAADLAGRGVRLEIAAYL